MSARRPRVLFLCTGNACRSQMAEGFARALKGGEIEAHSAGVAPHGLDPRAVRAMAEVGVDISGHRSEDVRDVLARAGAIDAVVTVCDRASGLCPVFPGEASVVHVPFDDPPALAAGARTDEEAMDHYRRVRDEIRAFIETLPGALAPAERRGATT